MSKTCLQSAFIGGWIAFPPARGALPIHRVTIWLMRMRFLAMALGAALTVATAWAADITGTWKGEINGPNGSFSLTYNFKQDGSKLTGTVTGPQGDPLELLEGKVDQSKIHFAVNVPFNGGTKFVSDGSIKGDDEISLETRNDSGDVLGPAITLKKQK